MRSLPLAAASALLIGFSACEKDEGTAISSGVKIEFRTGNGYTYLSGPADQGDTLRIGAMITEGSDPLDWLVVSLSLDSAMAVGIDTVNINSNPFNHEVLHVIRMQPGTEQVIFSAVEPDGDRTIRRLTFTVP